MGGRVYARLLRCGLAVCVIAGAASVPLPAAAAAGPWIIVPSPDANTSNDNFLNGVACTGAGDCWAVGRYGNTSGVQQTLIEHNSGSGWTLAAGANSSAAQDNELDGVTCAAVNDCWAVGHYNPGLIDTLIEHYDGSSWSIVASPNAGGTQSFLTSVACNSATDCSTVGQWNSNGGNYQTLIEHYNGSTWSIVPSPNTSASDTDFLTGVACSGGLCWASGYYYDGTGFHTLIEKNAGSGWSIVSSPNTSAAEDNLLNGITCTSASDCWAAGDYYDGSEYQTLIEHHTSTGWHIVSSANSSTSVSNQLMAITCTSSNDCVAVGQVVVGGERTLVEQYHAGAWSLVASGNAANTQADWLTGVACVASGACVAVGTNFGADRLDHTLIEQSTGPEGADLAVTLKAPATATVGSNVTYTLRVVDKGPEDANTIRVHFSLPSGTTFVSASGGGQLDANGDSVRWSISKLTNGHGVTLTVVLRMDQAKTMRAFASVLRSNPRDPNSANNSASVLTRVS